MPPLSVEMSIGGSWKQISTLSPGAQPNAISNSPLGGKKETYILVCAADDQSSTISRSDGLDPASKQERGNLTANVHEEVVATLRLGDAPFELTIRTEGRPDEPKSLRFQHVLPQKR